MGDECKHFYLCMRLSTSVPFFAAKIEEASKLRDDLNKVEPTSCGESYWQAQLINLARLGQSSNRRDG